jgi:methylisocitrate lyase
VVNFDEAVARVKAACDARDEYNSQFGEGTGPLILARTDALKTDGFEHAIERCLAFREAGCDMTFLEARKDFNSFSNCVLGLFEQLVLTPFLLFFSRVN